MTNRHVISKFMAGEEGNGSNLRSVKREVEGWPRTILYSYDEPIAVLDAVAGLRVSTHDYSVATNRHIGMVRTACAFARRPYKGTCHNLMRQWAGETRRPPQVRRVGHSTHNRSGRRLMMGEGGPAPTIDPQYYEAVRRERVAAERS